MKSFTLKFALTFLLGVGLASAAVAQKIGGTVKDSAGKPVVGASVIVEGSTLGASSGVDGQWSLNVPDASKKTLVISYIGMKTQRIAIGSKTQIDVTLEDESTAMDDVVVVGYATVKRRDVVGSVASVNAETLQQMPVASVAEAMTGRMAGVQVTATEKGRELNSLVQAAFQEAEAVMVKGLRLEETEALRLLLYRVIENLEEDRTTC